MPAGTTELVFKGLTAQLDPASVQVKGDGAFIVLSVTHRRDFLAAPVEADSVAILRALLDEQRDSLAYEQGVLDVYTMERQLLIDNRDLSGQNGVQAADLEAAANLLRERLLEVNLKRLELERRIAALNEEIARIQAQLSVFQPNRARRQAVSEVTVKVQADRTTAAQFALSYRVASARWSPRYDLRVDEVGEPVNLTYAAEVIHSSGEDWADVQLTLSTGDPTQSTVKPELDPWRLGFAREVQPRVQASMVMQEMRVEASQAEPVMTDLPPPPVTRQQQATTTNFAIALPYTIPADGSVYRVEIAKETVAAAYQYAATPKLDAGVFLTAGLTDWARLDLVSGPANLFFEGTYIGESDLDTANIGDTLTVSLGRDPAVVVERELDEQFAARNFLRNRTTDQRGYTITIRNNKRVPVTLLLQDQVPIPSDERIDVKTSLGDRVEYDEETGLLTWRLTLLPGTDDTVAFRYEVTYPRDRRVLVH